MIAENMPLATPALIPLHEIDPNPWQPRKHFDQAALIELAEDIRLNGLLQPIVVREIPEPERAERRRRNKKEEPPRFQIAAGERRWRALKLLVEGYIFEAPPDVNEAGEVVPGDPAKKDEAPGGMLITRRAEPDPRFSWISVICRELSDLEMMRVAISENEKRKDVSSMEEALAFDRMIKDLGITQEMFARKMGISRPTVTNRLRMLKLPAATQEKMISGKLGQSAAIQLLEWEKKHSLPPKFLELIASALESGKLKLSQFELSSFEYTIQSFVPGIVNIASDVNFDVGQECKDCPFFWGDPKQVWRRLCANPPHLAQLQREAAARKKEARKAELAASIEKFGTEVLRLPNGTPVQLEAERDEAGVSVVEGKILYSQVGYNYFKQFDSENYNGFDLTECQSCKFYARQKDREGTLTTVYVCLKPDHFQKLNAAHARKAEEASRAAAAARADEFFGVYGTPVLLGQGNAADPDGRIPPYLDKLTAKLLATSLMLEFRATALAAGQTGQWIAQHGLSTETTTAGYATVYVKWIEEELDRLEKEDGNYIEVVLKALACIMDGFLRANPASYQHSIFASYAKKAVEFLKPVPVPAEEEAAVKA